MLVEVAYDSTSLLDLHREFVAVTRDELRVFNFFEERKTRVLKVWFIQWEEFVSKPRPKQKLPSNGMGSVFENNQRRMTDAVFKISASLSTTMA